MPKVIAHVAAVAGACPKSLEHIEPDIAIGDLPPGFWNAGQIWAGGRGQPIVAAPKVRLPR